MLIHENVGTKPILDDVAKTDIISLIMFLIVGQFNTHPPRSQDLNKACTCILFGLLVLNVILRQVLRIIGDLKDDIEDLEAEI